MKTQTTAIIGLWISIAGLGYLATAMFKSVEMVIFVMFSLVVCGGFVMWSRKK